MTDETDESTDRDDDGETEENREQPNISANDRTVSDDPEDTGGYQPTIQASSSAAQTRTGSSRLGFISVDQEWIQRLEGKEADMDRTVLQSADIHEPVTLPNEQEQFVQQKDPLFRHGKYNVYPPIAQGGMGTIFLAFDRELQRYVAFKVTAYRGDDHHFQRFVQEASITGQLHHPNIVPIYEVGRLESGEIYYTMELVQGNSLGYILRAIQCYRENREEEISPDVREAYEDGKRFDEQYTRIKRLQLFQQICRTIQYAHRKGVIHRDIKPGNIMVGENDEIKVLDWGLATVIGEDREEIVEEPDDEEAGSDPLEVSQLTRHGEFIGTPPYLPPEQARGQVEKLDERSDIYSLGALLYELLTFTPCYQQSTSTLEETREMIEQEEPEPPKSRNESISPELDSIVMKCLSKQQEERYESTAELHRDIQAFLEDRIVSAHPTHIWGRIGKYVKRNREKVTALGTLFLMLAVAGGVYLWYISRPGNLTVEVTPKDATIRMKQRGEKEYRTLRTLENIPVETGQGYSVIAEKEGVTSPPVHVSVQTPGANKTVPVHLQGEIEINVQRKQRYKGRQTGDEPEEVKLKLTVWRDEQPIHEEMKILKAGEEEYQRFFRGEQVLFETINELKGSYRIEVAPVNKQIFWPEKRQVEIKADETKSITVSLTPDKALMKASAPRPFTLSVFDGPSTKGDASVGEKNGRFSRGGILPPSSSNRTFYEVGDGNDRESVVEVERSSGKYRLVGRAPGHYTRVRQLKLDLMDIQPVSFSFRKIPRTTLSASGNDILMTRTGNLIFNGKPEVFVLRESGGIQLYGPEERRWSITKTEGISENQGERIQPISFRDVDGSGYKDAVFVVDEQYYYVNLSYGRLMGPFSPDQFSRIADAPVDALMDGGQKRTSSDRSESLSSIVRSNETISDLLPYREGQFFLAVNSEGRTFLRFTRGDGGVEEIGQLTSTSFSREAYRDLLFVDRTANGLALGIALGGRIEVYQVDPSSSVQTNTQVYPFSESSDPPFLSFPRPVAGSDPRTFTVGPYLFNTENLSSYRERFNVSGDQPNHYAPYHEQGHALYASNNGVLTFVNLRKGRERWKRQLFSSGFVNEKGKQIAQLAQRPAYRDFNQDGVPEVILFDKRGILFVFDGKSGELLLKKTLFDQYTLIADLKLYDAYPDNDRSDPHLALLTNHSISAWTFEGGKDQNELTVRQAWIKRDSTFDMFGGLLETGDGDRDGVTELYFTNLKGLYVFSGASDDSSAPEPEGRRIQYADTKGTPLLFEAATGEKILFFVEPMTGMLHAIDPVTLTPIWQTESIMGPFQFQDMNLFARPIVPINIGGTKYIALVEDHRPKFHVFEPLTGDRVFTGEIPGFRFQEDEKSQLLSGKQSIMLPLVGSDSSDSRLLVKKGNLSGEPQVASVEFPSGAFENIRFKTKNQKLARHIRNLRVQSRLLTSESFRKRYERLKQELPKTDENRNVLRRQLSLVARSRNMRRQNRYREVFRELKDQPQNLLLFDAWFQAVLPRLLEQPDPYIAWIRELARASSGRSARYRWFYRRKLAFYYFKKGRFLKAGELVDPGSMTTSPVPEFGFTSPRIRLMKQFLNENPNEFEHVQKALLLYSRGKQSMRMQAYEMMSESVFNVKYIFLFPYLIMGKIRDDYDFEKTFADMLKQFFTFVSVTDLEGAEKKEDYRVLMVLRWFLRAIKTVEMEEVKSKLKKSGQEKFMKYSKVELLDLILPNFGAQILKAYSLEQMRAILPEGHPMEEKFIEFRDKFQKRRANMFIETSRNQ